MAAKARTAKRKAVDVCHDGQARRSRGRPNASTMPARTPKNATFLIAHRPRWARRPASSLVVSRKSSVRSADSHDGTKHSAPSDSATRAGDHRAPQRRPCPAVSELLGDQPGHHQEHRGQPATDRQREQDAGQHPMIATSGSGPGKEQPERPREVAERGRRDPEPRVGGQHDHREPSDRAPLAAQQVLQRPTAPGRRTARWRRSRALSHRRRRETPCSPRGWPHRGLATPRSRRGRAIGGRPRGRCRRRGPCRSRAATNGRYTATHTPTATQGRSSLSSSDDPSVTSRRCRRRTARGTAPSGGRRRPGRRAAGSRRRPGGRRLHRHGGRRHQRARSRGAEPGR